MLKTWPRSSGTSGKKYHNENNGNAKGCKISGGDSHSRRSESFAAILLVEIDERFA